MKKKFQKKIRIFNTKYKYNKNSYTICTKKRRRIVIKYFSPFKKEIKIFLFIQVDQSDISYWLICDMKSGIF